MNKIYIYFLLPIMLFFSFNLFSKDIRIVAFKSTEAPVIDGILDDKVWNKAFLFDNFKMVEPETGVKPSEKTELRMISTETALYIGIKNYDREPSKISVNSLDYDSKSRSNDVIRILIDPFQDRRNAYVFFVNAGGARTDGLAFGERFSTNWDGIWSAKTKINEDGWTAEIKIPFKTLSFKLGLEYWGINVGRYIPRKMEVIRMSGISKDSFFL